MNKCFITKYPSSINNDNLPFYGKFKIIMHKVDSPTANKRGIGLRFTKDTTVKVTGGHITDNNLSANLDNTKEFKANSISSFLISNEESEIILDKYDVNVINNSNVSWHTLPEAKNKLEFDLADIKFANLCAIYCENQKIYGDISNLSNSADLAECMLHNTKISGDISSLSNLVNLTQLSLGSTAVSGDISSLSNLVNLEYLNLGSTAVSGDISSLSNLVNLTQLRLGGTAVSGDISSIVTNLTKLKELSIPNTVTISDEQKKTLTDKGCTITIA